VERGSSREKKKGEANLYILRVVTIKSQLEICSLLDHARISSVGSKQVILIFQQLNQRLEVLSDILLACNNNFFLGCFSLITVKFGFN